jgi:transitional endoplasmic reticulum ATPase
MIFFIFFSKERESKKDKNYQKSKEDTKKEELIKLKVGELTAKDEAGRGIVRMDSEAMRKIGVKEGDIVELEGTRKTAAIVRRAYPADIGLSIIRMDGITRKNAGVGVGESVIVRRAEPVEARKVVLAPTEPGVILDVAPGLIRSILMNRPLVKGDIVFPLPAFKKKGNENTFFEKFFGQNFEDLFFSPFPEDTRFIVEDVEPKDNIVKIGIATDIEVLRKRSREILSEEDLPKERIINVKTLPDLEKMIEVKSLDDIAKILNNFYINKYDDDDKIVYYAAGYYYKIKKPKKTQ